MGKNKFMMMMTLLFLLLVMSMQGCTPLEAVDADDMEGTRVFFDATRSVARILDWKAGVVCWTNGSDGIYCMPIEDTNLDRGGE